MELSFQEHSLLGDLNPEPPLPSRSMSCVSDGELGSKEQKFSKWNTSPSVSTGIKESHTEEFGSENSNLTDYSKSGHLNDSTSRTRMHNVSDAFDPRAEPN